MLRHCSTICYLFSHQYLSALKITTWTSGWHISFLLKYLKYGFKMNYSFFFIACLLRQIWRFWKWKYFDSKCGFSQKIIQDRKSYFHFLSCPSLQPKWNILQVKFSSRVLYLFKTWSHLESLSNSKRNETPSLTNQLFTFV